MQKEALNLSKKKKSFSGALQPVRVKTFGSSGSGKTEKGSAGVPRVTG